MPEIVPVPVGAEPIVTVRFVGELYPQPFSEVTLTVPVPVDEGIVTLIVVVPCPDVMVAPEGAVH